MASENFNRETLPYRNCATGIVVDSFNYYLLTQTVYYREGEWRFPGGEVKEDEEPGTALMRELEGQLGTRNFEIVGQSSVPSEYEWPDNVVLRHFRKTGHWWRGQKQTQFLVRFIGEKKDIVHNPDEIREVAWVPYEELPQRLVFPNQWQEVKRVIEEVAGEGHTN